MLHKSLHVVLFALVKLDFDRAEIVYGFFVIGKCDKLIEVFSLKLESSECVDDQGLVDLMSVSIFCHNTSLSMLLDLKCTLNAVIGQLIVELYSLIPIAHR